MDLASVWAGTMRDRTDLSGALTASGPVPSHPPCGSVFAAILLVVVLLPAWPARASESPDEQQARTALRRVADEVRTAVLTRDPGRLMKLIHETGVPCGDAMMTRQGVRRGLQPGGKAHAMLWGPLAPRLDRYGGPERHPLVDLLRECGPVTVEVELARGGQGGAPSTGCVTFRAATSAYAPVFCFQRIGQRWYLSSGPIACEP